nr:hypothetical protein [Pseudomonas aeruginosa]
MTPEAGLVLLRQGAGQRLGMAGDQQIEFAELLGHPLHGARHLDAVTRVGAHAEFRLQVIGLGIEHMDRQAHAGGVQRQGNRLAQWRVGPGHQGGGAPQIVHWHLRSPFRC